MSTNKCPCCNSTPVESDEMISCQNIKCSESDIKYFIWEWQSLPKSIDALCENGSAACIQSLSL